MIVAVLRLELILHAPDSLKEKRQIVRKILDRCRSRFPVSAAETGLQELLRRSELAFVVVGNDAALLQGILSRLEDEIDQLGLADVSERFSELLHY